MSVPVVAVDGRRSFASGIGRYTSGVIAALEDLHRDRRLRLVALGSRSVGGSDCEWVEFGEPLLAPWDESDLSGVLRGIGADIVIAPQYYLSPFVDVPSVRVLHDAHPFWPSYQSPHPKVFEQLYGKSALERLAAQMGTSWKPSYEPGDRSSANLICRMYALGSTIADSLVTVSHYSASDLTHHMPITAGKWNVIYPYVDETLISGQRRADSEGRDPNALLLVSKFEPRKQQVETIEAVARLRSRREEDLRVTLVGGPTASFPDYGNAVKAAATANAEWVTLLEGVPDEHLSEAYSQSILTVFPSLSEGFGYPALESLSHGTAVLAAKGSSLPEVCGSAAYYYDEYSPLDDALSDAIDRARGVSKRAYLQEQALRFTRSKHREALWSAIELLL